MRVGQALRPVLPTWVQALVPLRERAFVVDTRQRPGATASATHGRACRLCATRARATDQRRGGARARPARRLTAHGGWRSGAAARCSTTSARPTLALATVRRNVSGRGCGCSTRPAVVSRRSSARRVVAASSQRTTATCCGTRPAFFAQARRVSAATRDLCEVIDPVALRECWRRQGAVTVLEATRSTAIARGLAGALFLAAWPAQCHGRQGRGAAAGGRVRTRAGQRTRRCAAVRPVLIRSCSQGWRGSYEHRKLDSLLAERPDVIATANIGCLEHLRQASTVPVRHWIEIVDGALHRAA